MPRLKFSRLECSLLLFPCALLLLTQLDKFRTLDAQQLSMSYNPLRRMTEDARRINCASNLKGLGWGLMHYQQDYDDRFPNSASSSCNWVTAIQPYVWEYQYHCPTDSFSAKLIPSYWMNTNLSDAKGVGLPLKSVPHPERTFLFGDWNAGQTKSPFTLDERAWSADASYAQRHLFSANYAFLDGHVKWLSSETVKALRFKSPQSSLYSWKLK